ncbi:EamA family transporter [Nitratireductor sp. CAU 1489]|uniref:EamA family transporter n=1 Tax=Nitratireductor arenosus TaxID=2682096 RepID=A0A844QE02_9HYPH|nr:DMT family transporter [Nitratireductor arenosus]MVA97522.1 EamA family transporter [Nitratireductor arenosus]
MTRTAQALQRHGAIDTFAAGLMIVLTFSWGLNGVAAKLAGVGYSPVLLTIMRSAIAALCVYGWCRWRGVALFERDGTMWPGILAGLLFGGEFVLLFWGLDYTSVARSALMLNTMPFWVLVGAHFLLGERMSMLKLAGTVLAFGGVALVFSDKLSLPGPAAIRGDIMCLVAGALWGATVLVIRKSSLATASPEKVLLYQLVVSAVLVLPLLAVSGPALREVTALASAAMLFQAIYVVALTYLVFFWLVRRYPAGGLASFAFLTPAFGVMLGGLLLDEPVSVNIVAALGLIAVGIVLANWPSRRTARG